MLANIKALEVDKRKHSSQMTPYEQRVVRGRLEAIPEFNWELSTHVKERLGERGLMANKYDLVSTIYNSNIIEYRVIKRRGFKHDERVVLRSVKTINGRYNLHVVFSLTHSYIISAWTNHVKDRHDTLDWSVYCENVRVAEG